MPAFAGMTNMSASFCCHFGENRHPEHHSKTKHLILNEYRLSMDQLQYNLSNAPSQVKQKHCTRPGMGKKMADFFIDFSRLCVSYTAFSHCRAAMDLSAASDVEHIVCIPGDKGEGAFWFPFRGAIAMEQVRQLSLHGP
jgi:hypothetical protein